jgi:rRNA maturation endonuclease Nob1
MQMYSKESLYQPRTACYGCDTMTSNTSGMCTDCGGSYSDSESKRPMRKAHTVSRAQSIIKWGNN